MSINVVTTQMLSRLRAEELFPPLAHDPGRRLFLLENDADENKSFLGACLIGAPLTGADDTTVERLKSIFSASVPDGTIVQISLLASPDIEPWIMDYVEKRTNFDADSSLTGEPRQLLGHMTTARAGLIESGRRVPLIDTNKVLTNDVVLLVSIKAPCALIPKESDFAAMAEAVAKLQEGLESLGMQLTQLDASEYLGIVRRILHMYESYDTAYDETLLLRDQILHPGDKINCTRDGVQINDTHVKTLSVKHYPKQASLAIMARLIGDPSGINNQLTQPWMLTLTLRYPQQSRTAARVRAKAQAINYQAYGPLLKWIPKLAYKKQGFDVLLHAMEEGDTLVEMSLSMALFSQDQEALTKLSSLVRTYYAVYQLEMCEDRYISWPVFWNTIPLFPSGASIANTYRFHTMGIRHAIQFLPILGEWRGTGRGGASIFVSRRGQPILFDLYDSSTSHNAVILAESGAGKSFLTQQLIVDYLSLGAKIWVIDVGRSYLKLAKALHGEFVEFSEHSRMSMNPFSLVEDINDESEFLCTLISKMAAPTAGLDDYHMSRLEEAIHSVWGHLGPEMTMTNIWDYLLQQRDARLRDLGTMLYRWTRHGSYGQWFEGQNTLNYDNNLVVFELEELKGKKTLQQVVLLQLIAKIQHEMYLSGSSRPKLLFIDEAWDLLDDPGVSKFMEHGYRRFRKYNGAAIVVTQSINDLYNSPNGTAIAENSPHVLVMQQKTESIAAVEKSGRISIEPYGFHQMRNVHVVPGKYSEVLIHTRSGWGIARLVVDRFSQVMYSTSGPERTQILSDIDRGIPAIESIDAFIAKNG